MRLNMVHFLRRLLLPLVGLLAMMSVGLSYPRPPSQEELREIVYLVAGGSLAEICREGSHQTGHGRCDTCCLAAFVSPSVAPRMAVRLQYRPGPVIPPRRRRFCRLQWVSVRRARAPPQDQVIGTIS